MTFQRPVKIAISPMAQYFRAHFQGLRTVTAPQRSEAYEYVGGFVLSFASELC